MDPTPLCEIPSLGRRDVVCIAVLIVVTCITHFPLLAGNLSLDEDSLLFFYPLRTLHSDSTIGFWDPYLFCGFPREANPQSQILYAPNILFSVFSASGGFSILLLGHLFLGAFFLYYLLRGLKLEAEASLFGALAFLVSTFWRCKITNLGLLEGISWVPGMVYFYLLGLETGKWTPYMAAALWLAMVILAGVPHTVLYGFLFLGMISIAYSIYQKPSWYHPFASLALVGSVALLLTIGMWLPALVYIPESGRSVIELKHALEGSISWQEIWKVFLGGLSQPEINRGDPWEGTCYIGVTALFFLPSGLFSIRKRLRLGLILAFLLAVICTLGADGFFYPFLYHHLPGWNMFNLPNRSLLIAALVLPVFAAAGFQSWLHANRESKTHIAVLLNFSLVLMLCVLLACLWTSGAWTALLFTALTQTFQPESISDSQWALLSSALWISVTSLVSILFFLPRSRKGVAVGVLCGLLLIQSYLYSPRLFLQTVSSHYFTPSDSTRLALKNSQETKGRVVSYVPMIDSGSDVRMTILRPSLMHRLPEVFRLEEAQGYDPLFPKRYGELIRAWAGHSRATDQYRTIRWDRLPQKLLDLLSVSTVIGYPNQEIVYSGKPVEQGQPGILETRPKKPTEIEAVTFRWLMAGAFGLPQGRNIASVNILHGSETLQTFPIRMGIEIANYVTFEGNRFARHKPATIFRWFPYPSPFGYMNVYQYVTTYRLKNPALFDRITIDYTSATGRLAILEISVLTTNKQGLELVDATTELPVYRNPQAIGRAYLTRRIARYKQLEDLINGFESWKEDQEIPVYFSQDQNITFEISPLNTFQGTRGQVVYKRTHSDTIQFQTTSAFDSYLVISENYSPNWTGVLDKQQSVPIQRANHAFMAVPVPAGKHVIELTYLPRLFFISISLGGAMLAVVLLILCMHPRQWIFAPRRNED